MGQLADILGPTAPGNLSSAAQGLREEFMEDPERQWDIAWDIRSRDIPPQLRSGAEEVYKRRAARWQAQNPFASFLPYAKSRDYRMGGGF